MKNKKLLITTIIIFVLGLMSLTFGILLDSTFKNIDVDERIFSISMILDARDGNTCKKVFVTSGDMLAI